MADPMYRQIAGDLRRRIESDELGPGSQLPTELELREQYEASRNTIRDALRWLITRGLIETRPGQGTFVLEKIYPFVATLAAADDTEVAFVSEVTAKGRKPTSTGPRVEIQQANDLISTALELENGTTVLSRHQQRFIDGTPWSLQTTFYPMRFIEAGAVRLIQAEDIAEGAVRYIMRLPERQFDRDLVTAVGEFGVHPLRHAVVGAGHEQDPHQCPPLTALPARSMPARL